ncbi:MAG: universal stress protein [Cyclobacteriaceae bacterium]|nr:universal stress protein [Cyclobacteriaceae bacterium]
MQKIIVPTDFSEQASHALNFAREIASQTGAKIVLMHVLEYAKKQTTFLGSSTLSTMGTLGTGVEMDDIYFIQLFKRRKEQMAEVLSDPLFANIDITDKILMGTPYHAIEEEITESDADFIIMGTTGVNDWAESLIGSTAEKVVRHASCPVLTLRKEVHLADISKIAFASDFKELNPPYMTMVKNIRKLFDAELHLVYINTPGHFKNEREINKNLNAFAAANQLDDHKTHIYSHEHEEEGIVCFAEDQKMNMVMMATTGRSGFSRLFEHSIAEDVVNFSKKPVVTFNLNYISK